MHLDEQLHVGPHGAADRLHQTHAMQPFFSLHFVIPGAEGIELETQIAFGDGRLGGSGEIRRRSWHLIPGVGIGLELVAHRAAQQNINRQVRRLADDVPAGDLHETNGRGADFSHPPVIVAKHPLHEVLDPKRIAAQDAAIFALIQIAQERVRAIGKTDLADPDQPLVGGELHKRQIPPGAAHDGPGDLRDFHGVILGVVRGLCLKL